MANSIDIVNKVSCARGGRNRKMNVTGETQNGATTRAVFGFRDVDLNTRKVNGIVQANRNKMEAS